MLGGVCGGLGDYLGIDPTFIRIFFFIMVFGGGAGFWIYVLLWVLVPEEGVEQSKDFRKRMQNMGDEFATAVSRPHPKSSLIVGGGLILLGGFWLFERLDISWLWWWNFDVLWPALLIFVGCVLLYRWFSERSG
jgi:phage shock protein PspC (stress-responsive transcriptional regulator)